MRDIVTQIVQGLNKRDRKMIALAKAMADSGMLDPDKFNKAVLEKAALVSTDFNSGTLKHERASAFIDLVVDESALLKAITVHRTDAAAGTIALLNVTGPITSKATQNTEYTNTSKPTDASVAFATAKSVSALDITGEVTEDTIEGGNIKATVLGAMTKQVGNDMEMLAIEGDDSITGTDTATDRLLSCNDGFHVLTADDAKVHDIDAGGKRVSFKLLQAMKRALPSKYKKNPAELAFIMSLNAAEDLAAEWAVRLTDLGDRARAMGMLPNILGIPVLPVPLLPEDLAISGTAGDTGTFVLLCNPKNLVYVVQRELTVEWERRPRLDRDECTMHMRTDFVYHNGDAIVKANAVNADEDATLYGAS